MIIDMHSHAWQFQATLTNVSANRPATWHARIAISI